MREPRIGYLSQTSELDAMKDVPPAEPFLEDVRRCACFPDFLLRDHECCAFAH